MSPDSIKIIWCWLRVFLVCMGANTVQATAQSARLTTEERMWMAAHPVIRLTPPADYQPIAFFDDQGQLAGITADYLALLQQRLSISFQVIRVDLTNERLDLDDPAQIGADVKVAITETPKRAERWLFTQPYLEIPAYIITRKEAREGLTMELLEGDRVAVVWHYAARQYLADHYPKLILDPVLDTRLGLRKVAFGLTDAMVSELPVSTYWIEREGLTNLKVSGESGYVYRLGIASRKDWPELHSILEKGLASITPEERTAIYQKWVKLPVVPSLLRRQWLQAALLGFTLAGVGLAGVLCWNRALATQVKKRTAALEQEVQEHEADKQALLESEEHLGTIIETIPECVKVLDAKGTLLRMNVAGLKIIGAQNASQVLGHGVYEFIAPEQQEAFRAFNERICAGERGAFEFELISLAGERRQIETFAAPIYDKSRRATLHLAFSRDVTERRQAEEALQQSEALFRSLTETTTAWVFIIEGGCLRYVNTAALTSLGYTREEARAINILDVIHPDDLAWAKARHQARREGRFIEPTYEVRLRTKTGETRWLQVATKPIQYRYAAALLNTGFDITERKLAEEQLKVSEQQLHQLAGYLQTVREEERAAMAREIHDELGQALTAMKIDLVRLSNVLPTPTAPAQERLDGLVELINTTIHTVRKLASQLRPGVLDDLGLAAALEWQAQEFQTRTGIACEFVELSEAASLGTEQSTAIFRICQEALTNVARHAQATQVTICLRETPTHLRLEVKDNGRGVTVGELTNPWSLGLLGMRERAFLLGGECHLTGAVNAGTTVTVQIPLQQTKPQGGA